LYCNYNTDHNLFYLESKMNSKEYHEEITRISLILYSLIRNDDSEGIKKFIIQNSNDLKKMEMMSLYMFTEEKITQTEYMKFIILLKNPYHIFI